MNLQERMTDQDENGFLGLSFHPSALTLVLAGEEQVQALAAKPMNDRPSMDGMPFEDALRGMLDDGFDDLFGEVGGRAGEIGVALPQSMAIIKKVPLALGLTEEAIQAQVRWEAEQFLISPIAEYAVSHQRLPFATPSGNPLYLQVLVRKRTIQTLQEFFKVRGLALKELDVDVFSSVRAVMANYDVDRQGTAALVEVQPGQLSFVIIHHQEYFLSHRVPLSSGAGASDVSKDIMKEMRRLMFGHRLGKGPEDLEAFFLTGHEIVHDIALEMGAKGPAGVQIMNPFRRLRVNDSCSRMEIFQRHPEMFTASTGLALKRVPALRSVSD
jgi:Tfp pilus assembly PilM family ATPase